MLTIVGLDWHKNICVVHLAWISAVAKCKSVTLVDEKIFPHLVVVGRPLSPPLILLCCFI